MSDKWTSRVIKGDGARIIPPSGWILGAKKKELQKNVFRVFHWIHSIICECVFNS